MTLRRAALTALLAAVFSLLCGCSPSYSSLQEAEAAGAVFGEQIFIDGVEVSGMSVPEARQALSQLHEAQRQGLNYTVTAGEDQITLSGSMIPVDYNTDEVLLQAIRLKKHYPAGNEPRVFSCAVFSDKEQLRLALQPVAAALNIAPADATVAYDTEQGCFLYTDEVEGREVDITDLANQLYGGISGESMTFSAKAEALAPAYTREMAEADTQLIAEFSTSFSGSTYGKEGRVHNIAFAADKIDGVTLKPGETFDMNAILGPRNQENGWKEAAAIRDGAYTQEYGGGVCQVSSTLYNVVLMADLAVTERHHHSWPLSYIDIGRDATISTGGPNFCFENSTEVPVTVAAYADTEEKTITIRIYGRKPDYTIQVTSKKVETLSDPGDEIQLDDSLPANTRKEQRKSRPGYIAETYKEYYDADGSLIRTERVTRDKYRPISGIVYVSSDLYYGAEEVAGLPAFIAP